MNVETKSVTSTIQNTHCIVCGSAFQAARKSKIYCSKRCKQFGYNHKSEIKEILSSKQLLISPETHSFFIDDYNEFIKNQKYIKRLSQLKQKKTRWEKAENELRMAQQYSGNASSFAWSTFLSDSLTSDEEDELDTIESELDERLWELRPRELSIEQWSFMKTLYPELDATSFVETIIGLSGDFIAELTLKPLEKLNDHSIIRNKFVNHCNMIALGKIRFVNRVDNS